MDGDADRRDVDGLNPTADGALIVLEPEEVSLLERLLPRGPDDDSSDHDGPP